MISFVNDYSKGACSEVMNALVRENGECNLSYFADTHTDNAIMLIKNKIKNKEADVYFLSGGTQTNLIASCAFLRPYEAVIAVKTGHIAVHETGAIESGGHKIIEVSGDKYGKITEKEIDDICSNDSWTHSGILTVKPRMVYISQSTELGTVYSKNELSNLRKVCDKHNLLLYCDGARLGSGLVASDVSFPFMAEIFDAFYIGGTKNGALFGEALVIINNELKTGFQYIMKQRGGVLAKGFLLGIQFEVLMQNNLYEKLAEHANKMANKLKEGLISLGIEFSVDSCTNQLFPIFPNYLLKQLSNEFDWETIDKISKDYTEIRLVTSWDTPCEQIESFLNSVRLNLI